VVSCEAAARNHRTVLIGAERRAIIKAIREFDALQPHLPWKVLAHQIGVSLTTIERMRRRLGMKLRHGHIAVRRNPDKEGGVGPAQWGIDPPLPPGLLLAAQVMLQDEIAAAKAEAHLAPPYRGKAFDEW